MYSQMLLSWSYKVLEKGCCPCIQRINVNIKVSYKIYKGAFSLTPQVEREITQMTPFYYHYLLRLFFSEVGTKHISMLYNEQKWTPTQTSSLSLLHKCALKCI